jgi:hypothetical protein
MPDGNKTGKACQIVSLDDFVNLAGVLLYY